MAQSISLVVLLEIYNPLAFGTIRIDNGGEFTSCSFYNYLLVGGTRIEQSDPNGDGGISVAEHAIQTIKAIECASVIDADLSIFSLAMCVSMLPA